MKRSDVKLLEITGFKKVIDLLNNQRAVERVQSEWADDPSGTQATRGQQYDRVKKIGDGDLSIL